jgi:hypothetical protein
MVYQIHKTNIALKSQYYTNVPFQREDVENRRNETPEGAYCANILLRRDEPAKP